MQVQKKGDGIKIVLTKNLHVFINTYLNQKLNTVNNET